MSSKMNSAIISKQCGERISVLVPWDKEVVEFFKTLNQRKWCPDKKEWSFPVMYLDSIHKMLSEKYQVVVREYKPIIHVVEHKGTHSEVKGEYDPTIFKLIEEVPNTTWDSMNRAFIMPNEYLDRFIDTLVAKHISFTLNHDTKQRNNKKVPESNIF